MHTQKMGLDRKWNLPENLASDWCVKAWICHGNIMTVLLRDICKSSSLMCPAMWWGIICKLILRPLPPPAHLQLTSSLEFLQRGKIWRIWSHTMTSGRQTVDTQEAVDLKALSCNITGLEAKSIWDAASIQFVVHNAWNYYGRAPPPVWLPFVPDAIMLDQISHASPSVFAYCKWSKTIGVGAAREVEAVPGPATSFTIAVENQGMRLTYMVAI